MNEITEVTQEHADAWHRLASDVKPDLDLPDWEVLTWNAQQVFAATLDNFAETLNQ